MDGLADNLVKFDEPAVPTGPFYGFQVVKTLREFGGDRLEIWTGFLVLQWDEARGVFLRIGWGKTDDKRFFDGTPLQVI